MKKQLALFLACFIMLWNMPLCAAPVDSTGAGNLPVCNLPAPTNLQRYFPNPVTVTYTWDPVVGAVKYFAVLTDLTLGGVVVSQDPVGTTASFSVIGGHHYEFKVAPMCAEKLVSTNYAFDEFTAPFIVIDLIVETNSGCSDYGSSIGSYTDFLSTRTCSYTFANDRAYWMKVPLGPGGSDILVYFKKSESSAFTYDMTVLDPSGTAYSMTCSSGGSFCQRARLSSQNGPLIDIFFEDENKISSYRVDGNSAVPNFTVHNTCPLRSTNGDKQSSQTQPDIFPINPFNNELMLFFSETPALTTQLRLLDLQGRVCLQTEIQPEHVAENMYSLPVQDLPAGLYFLQLSNASGHTQVRKILKQ